VPVIWWALSHLRLTIFLLLLAIGLIYTAVHESESEHPRQGYMDSAPTLGKSAFTRAEK
jgi:hypothetical protein